MNVKLIYKDGSKEEYVRVNSFKSESIFNNGCIQFYYEDEPIRILKSTIKEIKITDFST